MATRLFGDARDVAELGDQYDILAELGRGGSAIVYRARDRELGRDVAIKVVHPRPLSLDDDPVARLAREARTVAQLQHPNIVTVFAVRRLATGGLALVMQLVPGSTLKTVVQREGPLDPKRCERVLRDVAEALAYAHARGVVHRDVKPENVFLDEDTGRAMLADFGIARSAATESVTATGTAIGTPFYMSPEQVEGREVDGRSDVYSLGMVAWEMLTGRRPWDGESIYNVIYKQKHEELPPIEALRPGVPHRLQYIVERMLQKNPAARWAGADGLLVQLGRSVLPGDYARWERNLKSRVERWERDAAEREARLAREARDRSHAVARVDRAGTSGATIAFPRRPAGARRPDAAGDAGLANTVAFTVGAPAGGGEADGEGGAGTTAHATPAPAAAATQSDTAVVTLRPPTEARGRYHAGPGATGGVEAGVEADAEVEPLAARVDAEPHAHRTADPSLTDDDDLRAAIANPTPAPAVALDYGAEALPTWAVDSEEPRRRWRRGPLLAGAVAAGAALVMLALRSGLPGTASLTALRPTLLAPPTAAPARGSDPAAASTGGELTAGGGAGYVGHDGDVLALGARHSCVVTFGGSLACWGANDRGQLGDASGVSQSAPSTVLGELSYTRVTAGLGHSCALTRLGDAYCWGNDARGQLGDAMTVRRLAPVRTAGSERFVAVRAGAAHTCALAVGGEVFCWGANEAGQLGDGSTTSRTRATRVRLPQGVQATAVAVGAQHTCALGDGRLWCWGANRDGQLGDGTTLDRATPTPVAVAGGTRFAAVSAGVAHSCAITAAGRPFCWGRNETGQLGTGTRLASRTPAPVQLPDSVRLRLVATGTAHTCALDSDGAPWCWGRNAAGQLGDATREDRYAPVRVAGAPGPLATLAVGAAHSCAVTADGRVLCWGANADGQLGDSTRRTRALPAPVALPPSSPAAVVALR